MYNRIYLILSVMILFTTASSAQSAYDIVKKADDKMKGLSSYTEMAMRIKRVDWSREIKMKAWSQGDEKSLILITSPKREKGISFLKLDNEMWNWQPSIERSLKMPPSMMMQSWMGSDFTNDDLAKQSSIVTDYIHTIESEETLEGLLCYVIALEPKEDAPVVWGKVKMWVSKKELLQLKVEFYDEENYLINTMYGEAVKEMDGRLLPSILRIVPEEEPENSTEIEYLDMKFGIEFKKNFFTIQNMKRLK